MYTPPHNREPYRAKIIAFMREYPFATLVTTRDEKLSATHLPVLIDERGEHLFITAHVAKVNPHEPQILGKRRVISPKAVTASVESTTRQLEW